MNELDAQAYLHDVFEQITEYPVKRVAELLYWNLGTATLLTTA